MTEQLKTNNEHVKLTVNNSPIQMELGPGRLIPKVGCLGPEGTYTEEARDLLLMGNDNIKIRKDFLARNVDVVGKVDSGEYDGGAIPVENLEEGEVSDVWKALLRTNNTQILGEVILPIDHMLIGWSDEEIHTILSHEQALGQCRKYLEDNYPLAILQQTTSTAKAAEEVLKMKNAAAIAGRRVAKMLNIPILARNIGDNKKNATRFFLIGRGETEPTGNDVTIAIIQPEQDRVGILRDCLDVFAGNNINLTYIHSYTTKRQMGEYLFLISFDGHKKDILVKNSLRSVKSNLGASYKILGSYKKAAIPEGSVEPGAINGH